MQGSQQKGDLKTMKTEGQNKSASNDLYADPDLWHCEDASCTEDEVAVLLSGLVRGLQPEVIVELGAYTGATTSHLGRSAWMNGHGHVYALDTDSGFLGSAHQRCFGLPVTLVCADAMGWSPPAPVDLLYVDNGEVSRRLLTLHRWTQHMSRRGIIAVHDTGSHWSLGLAIRNSAILRDWPRISLPTPRGLTLLRVPPGRGLPPAPPPSAPPGVAPAV